MFGTLTEKLQGIFSHLLSNKTLTEDSISDAVRQVRLALLDADVNYSVASQFIKRVKEKVLGTEKIKELTAKDQFISIVHEELSALMGKDESSLNLSGYPTIIMLCGLQGSGKTTQSAKLAYYLKHQLKKKPMLAACDLQRPAAIHQLKVLGEQVGVEVFSIEGEKKSLEVAKGALKKAKTDGFDVLILDTAGRLHIDKELMDELENLKKSINPHEILFVASAATGQDAVNTAAEFDKKIAITGTILTMLDGNARAGAAISIREITQKPLKFEGIGEKITDLQVFNPHSMADRILGMGDIINLVKKTKDQITDEEAEEMEKKLRKASFTYEDYLKQMGKIKKMGSIKSLLKMIPGLSGLGNIDVSDKEFSKLEAMILSMTHGERQEKVELVPTRRRRIAKGSGTTIDDVNKLVKGFKQIKTMMKGMPKMKKDFLNQPEMMQSALKNPSSFLKR